MCEEYLQKYLVSETIKLSKKQTEISQFDILEYFESQEADVKVPTRFQKDDKLRQRYIDDIQNGYLKYQLDLCNCYDSEANMKNLLPNALKNPYV